MTRTILIFMLSAMAAFAQEKTEDGKSKLVFPAATGGTEASAAKSSADKPATIIETFYFALKAGQVDAAYDALIKNTIIAERQDDVRSLKDRTKEAIDSYGKVKGYEVIEERSVGTSLMRRTCISLNEDLPLRWRFYFYKSDGEWRLVDLRVDDGLVELFEDAARAKK